MRIGLSRICQDLAAKAAGESLSDSSGTEQIEVFPVAGAPRVRRKALVEDDSLAASLSSWSDPMWEVKDRSVAGLRIAATGGIGQSLTLGALVAVRQSDVEAWLLGVVRRLNKVSNEEVEAGVNIIAERLVPVMLAAKRRPSEDMGYVIDRHGSVDHGRSLRRPVSAAPIASGQTAGDEDAHYPDARNMSKGATSCSRRRIRSTRSPLRHLVEQRPDWCWATIQIVEKTAREG